MNFQMFKLVLEKAEEPKIKLPTSAGLSSRESELTEPLNGTDCNWESILSTDPDMSESRTEK